MQEAEVPALLMEGYYIAKWYLQQGCQLAMPVESEITDFACVWVIRLRFRLS